VFLIADGLYSFFYADNIFDSYKRVFQEMLGVKKYISFFTNSKTDVYIFFLSQIISCVNLLVSFKAIYQEQNI
jgi:hypothetical protein